MSRDRAQLGTRRVYAGRILNVDIDTVRFPDGSTGELEMVRHPGASAVVPMLTSLESDDPQILLIKQFRYAAEDFIYEIPAGKLDDGEDPARCASRELKEETGCSAERIEHLTTFFTTPGFTDERIHAYVATGITRGPVSHERDEFMSVEAHPLSRVLEMIRSGEMMDAKSALTILYLAGFKLGR